MKNFIFIFNLILLTIISSCSNGQKNTSTNLSAKEFSEKLKQTSNAVIIDVRTPEEFSGGHIENAINVNWNGNDFEKETELLDKTKPIFVYCLSGGRSAAAANNLRAKGFKEVYELDGGMMKWRAQSLPETTNTIKKSIGLSKAEFEKLIDSDKKVLVDFYADWCAPCKKMKPYLEEISKEMVDKVIVVKINADENAELSKELGIEALPVLQIYINKQLKWSNQGYIEKVEVVKQLQ